MSEPAPIDAAPPADAERHALDAQLLHRAGRGDPSALGELYDRWIRPLHALACNILRDPAESEERRASCERSRLRGQAPP